MAFVSFSYSRAGDWMEIWMDFFGHAGREGDRGHGELRAIYTALSVVGRASDTDPGYWTGARLDRFIHGEHNCVAGRAVSRTCKWEIDAFGVNFPLICWLTN